MKTTKKRFVAPTLREEISLAGLTLGLVSEEPVRD